MKDTKQIITEKALELFNEKGIEYVGMRELAASMDTRIGNITYYFPTKDDLVYHLGTAYRALNTETRAAQKVHSMESLLVLFTALYHNQVKYRCMPLSFVHLVEHNAAVALAYKEVRIERSSANESLLRGLAMAGYLKTDDEQLGTLARSFNLISRFWLSEAIISGHHRSSLEGQIPAYIRLLANLLKPYATAKGRRDMERFFGEQ